MIAPIGYKYVLVPLYDPKTAKQSVAQSERETAMTCYQIASSHEFGPDAAKTIMEKFGLEI